MLKFPLIFIFFLMISLQTAWNFREYKGKILNSLLQHGYECMFQQTLFFIQFLDRIQSSWRTLDPRDRTQMLHCFKDGEPAAKKSKVFVFVGEAGRGWIDNVLPDRDIPSHIIWSWRMCAWFRNVKTVRSKVFAVTKKLSFNHIFTTLLQFSHSFLLFFSFFNYDFVLFKFYYIFAHDMNHCTQWQLMIFYLKM